jgi:hypothetical protein
LITSGAILLTSLLFHGAIPDTAGKADLPPCGIYRITTEQEPCRRDTSVESPHYREAPGKPSYRIRLEASLGSRYGLPIAFNGLLPDFGDALDSRQIRLEIPFMVKGSCFAKLPGLGLGFSPWVMQWHPGLDLGNIRIGYGAYAIYAIHSAHKSPLGLEIKLGWEYVQRSELAASVDLAIGYPWRE